MILRRQGDRRTLRTVLKTGKGHKELGPNRDLPVESELSKKRDPNRDLLVEPTL